ncbi:MAG: hypothetical protein ACRD2R_06275 [Terriglobales bacterium]
MQLRLATRSSKLGFAAVCLAVTALNFGLALRGYLASRFAATPKPESLELAAQLEPGNASHRSRLGRYYVLAGNQLETGIASFQAAARLNPFEARHWLDLAMAYQISGDQESVDRALQHALQVEPTSPRIAWEAANLYVLQGHLERTLPLLKSVLQRDPFSAPSVVELGWKATRDVDLLFQKALPQDARVYLALLSVLLRYDEAQAADSVWSRAMGLRQPFPLHLAVPYLNFLVSHREGGKARKAWEDLARFDEKISAGIEAGNLVVNGGFEAEILQFGLDWRLRPVPGVQAVLDASESHAGRRSLKITWDGAHIPEAGVVQLIPLDPDSRYLFSAYVKTAEMSSVANPRLLLLEALHGTRFFLSEELSGTEPWHRVSGELVTSPETRFAALKMVREPYPGQARGSLWLDDVRLEKVGDTSSPGGSPTAP